MIADSHPTLPWRLCGVAALTLAACHECGPGDESRARDAQASPALRTVAMIDGPIDALAAGRDALFGIESERGVVFSVALSGDAAGAVRQLAVGEREPFALVVRAGSPVWASREGVFVCDPDGHARRQLVASEHIRALASGPHGVVFSDDDALWRMEWPQASKAVRLAEGVDARELAATDEAVVWLERWPGSAWMLDLKSGSRKELAPAGRKGHDLSLANDGHSVMWHEGEADLLPGREPKAFLADTLSGAVRELPGAYLSYNRYLMRGTCVLGPATCKSTSLVDWKHLDKGEGRAPIADDSDSFYWVSSPGARDTSNSASKVVATRKQTCCP
jgi:hypothetical protein